MRLVAAALAVLAPAAASAADTPGDLLAGHDYMLSANANENLGTAELVAPGGAVVASVQVTNSDDQPGDEFRAAYSATYTLRTVPSDASLYSRVLPDCRGSTATLCHISVNHTRQGGFSA